MDKALLIPGSGSEYENQINELEEFLFNAINDGSVLLNDESNAYEFSLTDLDFEFPIEQEDLDMICSDIKDELDFRLSSYSEALDAANANSEEPEEESTGYTPAVIWIEDNIMFIRI